MDSNLTVATEDFLKEGSLAGSSPMSGRMRVVGVANDSGVGSIVTSEADLTTRLYRGGDLGLFLRQSGTRRARRRCEGGTFAQGDLEGSVKDATGLGLLIRFLAVFRGFESWRKLIVFVCRGARPASSMATSKSSNWRKRKGDILCSSSSSSRSFSIASEPV